MDMGRAVRTLALGAVIVMASASLLGCSPGAAPTPPAGGTGQQVSGTADFSSKTPLPSDAQMVVSVVDNSKPDSATATIGETTVTVGGKTAPIPFQVAYDLSAVNPDDVCVVRATITSASKALWVTKGNVLVITQGQPTAGVAVPLKQP